MVSSGANQSKRGLKIARNHEMSHGNHEVIDGDERSALTRRLARALSPRQHLDTPNATI
jgi:hypothetical protein